MALDFRISARCGAARAGVLETPHGPVATPAFMPVGTLGAVKGLLPDQLAAAGAQILLANLYHLALRPGVEVVEALGGLHRFVGWPGPMITDSGGFQVFSLAALRQVDDDGVTFRDHLDGSQHRLTPEIVVELQRRLGVDLAMVLDECPPWPVSRPQAAASLERTLSWARRAREAWPGGPGGLFGIVQGSTFRDLRQRAAEDLCALDFDGHAVGGVSVGEPEEERRRAVEWTAPVLPEGKVRYLMGVGYPHDILHAVTHGFDLFDCVLPARAARHGLLFTRRGELRINNARFRRDPRPPDPSCACPTCRQVSRAFLHHLMRHDELSGKVFASMHNLHHYLDFMGEIRQTIAAGTLEAWASRTAGRRVGLADPDDDPAVPLPLRAPFKDPP
jgi:queuine tRNA-ribosyltransferase